MSENERHCPSVVKNADGDMRCAHGHQMVHYFYLQDARFEISQLKEQLEMYNGFKPTALTEMPPPDDDYLGVDIKGPLILLTLRGKSKLFTPKAIADLIRVLKKSYNAANNYSPPASIHYTNGIES